MHRWWRCFQLLAICQRALFYFILLYVFFTLTGPWCQEMEWDLPLGTNMVDFALLRNHHRYHPRLGNRFGANCQFVHIPYENGNWRARQTIQGWQLWSTHHPSIRIPWGSRRYRRLIVLGSIFLLVSPTSRIEYQHTTRNIVIQRLRISFAYVFMERLADLLEPTPNFLWWSSTLDVIDQLLPQNREHIQELLPLSSFIHLGAVGVWHYVCMIY